MPPPEEKRFSEEDIDKAADVWLQCLIKKEKTDSSILLIAKALAEAREEGRKEILNSIPAQQYYEQGTSGMITDRHGNLYKKD